MVYTPPKLLTFDDFITNYGDDPRYELADGELIDRSPTGPHEVVGAKLVIHLSITIAQQRQYRLGEPITSPLLPTLQLRLDDVLPR